MENAYAVYFFFKTLLKDTPVYTGGVQNEGSIYL